MGKFGSGLLTCRTFAAMEVLGCVRMATLLFRNV
jgi:hypothetical protein